jgi:hypothetical protein
LGNDEVVLFADAVHPTHAARPVGCWALKQDKLAIEQTSGRERRNQSRERANPDDRRSNRRCRLDNNAARSD